MKCVCEVACQKRVGNRIVYFHKGQVQDFEECPACFRAVRGDKINFLTASEEELMTAKWSIKDAKMAMKLGYGVDLLVDKDDKKRDIVDRILDTRKRNQPKKDK
jgi:hypothetical protein